MSVPLEVLIGIAYGLLFGTVLAFALGVGGVLWCSYTTHSNTPRAVIVFALAAAAIGAHWIGALEATGGSLLRVPVAAVVIVLLTLYALSQADRFAAALPRETAFRTVRERTLAASAVDAVDAMGQVTIRSSGTVRDLEGYPPLDPDVRRAIEDDAWLLPADLPLPALESRLADRIRTTYDLESVSVSIDPRGGATITVAPPAKAISRRLEPGHRAVSITTVLPPGLEPDDRVRVETADSSVSGRVVALSADRESRSSSLLSSATIAVPTSDATTVLEADHTRLVVVPAGTSQAFETLSLLERAGQSVRRLVLDAERLATLLSDDRIRAFAIRRPTGNSVPMPWQFEPSASSLEVGDEVFVIGEATVVAGLGERSPTRRTNALPEVVA